MVVYHYDRSGQMNPGAVLRLSFPRDIESIHPDIAFKFFPDGLSRHGIQYFSDYYYIAVQIPFALNNTFKQIVFSDALKDASIMLSLKSMELVFELVRRAMFPQLPSRFQSVFALGAIDELHKWPELRRDGGKIFALEVAKSQSLCFDANLLRGGLYIADEFDTQHTAPNLGLSFSPALIFEQAYKYWRQESSDCPRMEYLLPLPVQLGKEVFLPQETP